MQVILLERIGKLGNLGDVVKVKDGFARNFLLPQSKAIRATEDSIKEFEAKKTEVEKQNKENMKEAEVIAAKIHNSNLVFISQAGDDGRLYGSIGSKEISKKISGEFGVEVSAPQVALGGKIKDIGIYNVSLQLHPEVEAIVNINISRSEEEARAAFDQKAKDELAAANSEKK